MGLSFTRTQTGGNDGYTHSIHGQREPGDSDAEPVRLGNSRTTDSEITNHELGVRQLQRVRFHAPAHGQFQIDALSTLSNLSFYRFTISGPTF